MSNELFKKVTKFVVFLGVFLKKIMIFFMKSLFVLLKYHFYESFLENTSIYPEASPVIHGINIHSCQENLDNIEFQKRKRTVSFSDNVQIISYSTEHVETDPNKDIYLQKENTRNMKGRKKYKPIESHNSLQHALNRIKTEPIEGHFYSKRYLFYYVECDLEGKLINL